MKRTRKKRRESTAARGGELALSKKVLFAAIVTLLFFVAVELVLALIGIRPALYDEDPYVGFASNVPLFVEERRSDGVDMVTAANKLSWFNHQRFSKEKPDETYRIFTLGGSTTYGRPYDDHASFSGFFRELLPVADPSRRWEVINAGGVSYASYRVAKVAEELAGYDPDLFIIYTGHNEFLEERTYRTVIEAPRLATEAGAILSRTRVYALASRVVDSIRDGPTAEPTVLESEVDPRLEHSVGPEDYTRDDELRERTIDHFRFNLHRMIDVARSVDAEVVLVVPASNLKDCSPFKSEHRTGLSAEEKHRFDALLARAEEERAAGELEAALASLEKAALIDERFAELHYRKGLVLYRLGREHEAREALLRALDEDICPLRALTAITRTVREVASERNVPLVDFEKTIRELSPGGIPGSDAFLDHVHLDLEGYRRLAIELVTTLERAGILEIGARWTDEAIRDVTETVESRIDRDAHGEALKNLAKVLAWAGKLDEAERIAAEATEILGDDAESLHTLGIGTQSRGELDEAVEHYQRAIELDPHFAKAHNSLGVALAAMNRRDEAIESFRRALEASPEFAEAHYNLAHALSESDRLDEAAHHFQSALEHRPRFADAANNLGILLMGKGEREAAMEEFRRVIAWRPDFAEAHNNLGMALAGVGAYGEAVVHFRRALEIDPGFAEAHYFAAMSLAADGDVEEATRHFERALELEPDHAEAHFNLGNTLSLSGRVRDAIPHYREALRARPEWTAPMARLAWILATAADGQIRDADAATALAERLAEGTGYRDPAALDVLAAACAAAGDFDRAVRVTEQALALVSGPQAEKLEARLALYQKAEPYREP